ncbi:MULTISPECIES: ammonium transporter [unclassified Coleofasciculus]|uniref:ammonium transporter n=1 Tax=unclassified Coleofasciculus TaxID=2692782 RepID=UPI00187DF21C|nr:MULTISPECIES: ammonium transporter [unclassified Coleofasciculus]MBE9129655.1 ammonium transporter [Coleofasciculus sp. LEGE 07081]MBE9152178.1 ammonium transporter [Coleofasciculus sp. LEGE 07092]
MIDILWLLVCSGLVFLMQPGFMCLESGLTRSKNSINVAIKNLADFGISVALFWAFGYAIMFGVSQLGWIGSTNFLVKIESAPELAAFFLFQAMFCSTATTIVSGAVAERMKFRAYLFLACLISGLIYPLFGHWAWNGVNARIHTGWLGQLGFVDFAGSTVVHSIGGWVSLASLLIIGARAGRFPADRPSRKIHGSNLPLSVLGVMLLWFGWLGFNGGSTLRLTEQVAGIMGHTILAGVAGMIAAVVIGWKHHQVPDVKLLLNGSLAGLVSVTASCHAVTTPFAVLIGAMGGAVMILVSNLLEHWKIDDAVDAVPVHLGAGVWGTLAVALFGEPELLNTGLSRISQVGVQLLGIIVAGIWAFGLTYLLLLITNRFFPLRVSLEDEQIGLNISEHRAKTEIYDLFQVMEAQAQTQDLSLRVPVEPFTEVGQIAQCYNQVMDALEDALTRTDAIVKTAMDAIITFTKPELAIATANPSAAAIFGYSPHEFTGLDIHRLLEWSAVQASDGMDKLLKLGRQEVIGRRADGTLFPMEATVTEAKSGQRSFYTGTFRDISERKQAEAAIFRANREITLLNERLKTENLRLSAELEVTRRLQQMLLPKDKELNEIAELEIAGFMEPAAEVGGDYYDVLSCNGRVKIGIGDVTGHGLESGVLTIMVQTAVRTLLEGNETDPKKFLDILNRTIYHNVQRMNCDKNLTLSLLDYHQGILNLSGQHEEMIVVRAGGQIERIDTIDLGFPIGLEADITEFVAHAQLQLNPGDVVVLYTDGITEAENLQGLLYGVERLCEVLSRNWQQPAQEIRQAVIDDVRQHIGEQKVFDDITLLVLKQKP